MHSLQFIIGMILMLIGFAMNYTADRTLLQLRRLDSGYQIPYGGMFEHVSSPHYLGEIIEWVGYSLAGNGNLASISFVVFTACNLIPRALAQHQWYQQRFKDYPLHRKAVIPLIL